MFNREGELTTVLTDFIRSVVRDEVKKCLAASTEQVPAPGPIDLPLKANVKKRPGYPPLFQKFMDQYPVERRKERPKAYTAWCRISDKDKIDIVAAARNYVAAQLLEAGSYRFVKYPERFISHKTYLDYMAESDDAWIIKAIEYFDSEYLRVVSEPHIWSGNARQEALALFKAMGRDEAKRRIWIFFSGKERAVRELCAEKGYGFFLFRSISQTTLLSSALTIPVACKYCGRKGSHADDCKIILDKIAEEEKEMAEIEAGRLQHVDLSKLFKSKLQEKKDVES